MFDSRQDAGKILGRFLSEKHFKGDLVLGLPRGGVIVAQGVALELRLPLDTLVVRKIGHPWNREFAVGALAEDGTIILDEHSMPADRSEVECIIAEEQRRLADYESKFHRGALPDLKDKSVLLVDDGIATGATTEVAINSAWNRGAAQVFVAAPVASTSAIDRLRPSASDVFIFLVDPDFQAVGQYYREFTQTTDEEVVECLRGS